MPKISQSTLDMIGNIHTYDVVTRLGHGSKRSGQSIQVRYPNPNHYEKTPDTTKRRYKKNDILALGLRSIPKTYQEVKMIIDTLLQEGVNLERVPGFTQKLRKGGNPMADRDWYWTINAYGKYFIPIRDDAGRIVRMRMATENPKKKYTWFSSSPNVEAVYDQGKLADLKILDPTITLEGNAAELRCKGASSGHHISVMLPSAYMASWEPGDDVTDIMAFDSVIVSEGEHKSFISANYIQRPVIGVPGVGNYRDVLPALKKWNCKRVIIAYDADAFLVKEQDGPKIRNQGVYRNLINFAKEILEAEGIELVFWVWNINDGKLQPCSDLT
ncbi:hypothetical protein J2T17_006594 [Paenibacillus mucilaginosus]|uniref:toprim domain-containing protein n=1 Tax=Paenibacillus mucilaginosus TaxID=61624 RepID=UPI003D1DE807